MNFNSEVYNKLVNCKNWSDLEATGYTPHLDPTYSAYMKHIYQKDQHQEALIREQDSKIKELTQEIIGIKKSCFNEDAYMEKFGQLHGRIDRKLGTTAKEKEERAKFLTSLNTYRDCLVQIDTNHYGLPEEVFDIIAPNEHKIGLLTKTNKIFFSKIQTTAFDVLKKKAEQGDNESKLCLLLLYKNYYEIAVARYIQYMKSTNDELSEFQSKIDPQKILDETNKLIDSITEATFDEAAYLEKFNVVKSRMRNNIGSTEEEIEDKYKCLVSEKVSGDLFVDKLSKNSRIRVANEVFDILAPKENEISMFLQQSKPVFFRIHSEAFDNLKKKAAQGDRDSKLALTIYYVDFYNVGQQRYIRYMKLKNEKFFDSNDFLLYQSQIDPQKLLVLANEMLDSL